MFNLPHNQIAPFTPGWLKDVSLDLWAETSDTSPTNIIESLGKVSQLTDRSGHGRHLIQPSGGNQPTTGIGTENGMNILDCDGGEYLEYPNFPIVNGDVAFFVVLNMGAINQASDAAYSLQSGNANFEFDSNDGSQFNGQIDGSNGLGNVQLTGGPFSGLALYNLNWDFTGANIYNAYINNIKRTVDTVYNTPLATGSELKIFASRGGNSPEGAICEVIIISDPSEVNRVNITNYAMNKWGIQ